MTDAAAVKSLVDELALHGKVLRENMPRIRNVHEAQDRGEPIRTTITKFVDNIVDPDRRKSVERLLTAPPGPFTVTGNLALWVMGMDGTELEAQLLAVLGSKPQSAILRH